MTAIETDGEAVCRRFLSLAHRTLHHSYSQGWDRGNLTDKELAERGRIVWPAYAAGCMSGISEGVPPTKPKKGKNMAEEAPEPTLDIWQVGGRSLSPLYIPALAAPPLSPPAL